MTSALLEKSPVQARGRSKRYGKDPVWPGTRTAFPELQLPRPWPSMLTSDVSQTVPLASADFRHFGTIAALPLFERHRSKPLKRDVQTITCRTGGVGAFILPYSLPCSLPSSPRPASPSSGVHCHSTPHASLRCESRWTRLRRRGRCLSMTVLEQVRALIERLSPLAICDDCIAEKLGLSVRQHANQKTRELAGTAGFERRQEPCSMCNSLKKVIRKRDRKLR